MKWKEKARKWAPAAAFGLAIALLAGGTVGNVRAALTYYSENYDLDIDVPSIGVTLEENGRAVAWRNYQQDNSESVGSNPLLAWAGEESQILPGRYYTEELAVLNSGSVDSYVRVELFRYWTDDKGNKITTLEPDQIYLDMGSDAGWYIDQEASTPERTVLYYSKPLAPGERSSLLSTQLMMSNAVKESVKETTVTEDESGRTFTVTYAYDGVRMCLDAEVYAVQAHNAQAAIKSAWGRSVLVDSAGNLQFTNGNSGTGNGMWDQNNGTNSGSGVTSGSGMGSSGSSGSSGNSGSNSNASRLCLNTNTKKVHASDCRWVPNINQMNKEWTNKTLDELIAEGYKPCVECLGGSSD